MKARISLIPRCSNQILSARGSARFGELQFHEQKSGQIELGGQGFVPDKQGPADAVLITYDNAEGEPVICAIVSLEVPREPRLRATWDPSALPSRWGRILLKIVFLKDNGVS